jgi:hypothetical protein
MWRSALRWLVSLAVLLCWLPALQAQEPTEKTGPGPPVFQYALVIISTLVVLLIVCKPSRKR